MSQKGPSPQFGASQLNFFSYSFCKRGSPVGSNVLFISDKASCRTRNVSPGDFANRPLTHLSKLEHLNFERHLLQLRNSIFPHHGIGYVQFQSLLTHERTVDFRVNNQKPTWPNLSICTSTARCCSSAIFFSFSFFCLCSPKCCRCKSRCASRSAPFSSPSSRTRAPSRASAPLENTSDEERSSGRRPSEERCWIWRKAEMGLG